MFRLIIFYVAIGLVLFGISQTDWTAYLHPDIKYIWTFYLFMAYLSHLIHQMGMQHRGEKLVPFHMGAQALRFILSLLFVGVFGYLKTDNIYLFIINFFVLYLCSTYFEISGLLRNLRRF